MLDNKNPYSHITNKIYWKMAFLRSEPFVSFLDLVPEAVIISDKTGLVMHTNNVAQALFQYLETEFKKKVIEDLVPARIKGMHEKMRDYFFNNPYPRFLEGRHLNLSATKKDGSEFPMESALFAIHTDEGVFAVNLLRDISTRKDEEKKISEYAFIDALTNLPNRRYFEETMTRTLAKVKRHHQKSALLFIDIDKFKLINDHYSHEAGDQLLHEIGFRLSKSIRDEDFVARLGGDEFVVIVYPVEDESYLCSVADRILKACAEPVIIMNHDVQVMVSIGINIIDQAGDAKEWLAGADAAMYTSKKQGGSCFSLWNSSKS